MRRHTIIACLASSFVGLAASPGCSSTSGGEGFGDSGPSGSSGSSSSSTGSSTGGGTSSGTSSGGSTSSGSSSSASSSGTGSSSGIIDAGPPQYTDGGIPKCNDTPCDLQSNTCCVTELLTGSTCIAHDPSGTNQGCPNATAAFSCLQASDCTTAGEVCCGEADSNAQTAGTSCRTVVSGGSPCGASTSTAAYAQICTKTMECKNGMQCIPQVCAVVISGVTAQAHLTMCGLQTQAPFNCSQ